MENSDIVEVIDKKLKDILNDLKKNISNEYKDDKNSKQILNRSNEIISSFMLNGGKRLRPLLTVLVARVCGAEINDKIYKSALSLEFVHNSTLMHDDWMDEDEWRRGAKTTHESCKEHYKSEGDVASKLFKNTKINKSVTEATLLGNIACSEGFLLLKSLDPKIASLTVFDLIKTYQEVNEGQILDTQKELDFDGYLTMIKKKTSVLFTSCAKIGAYLAGKNEEFAKQIGDAVLPAAMSFQITDDLLDLSPMRELKQGSDIKSGKKNILSIAFYENASSEQKEEFSQLFGNQNLSKQEIEKAIIFYKEAGAIKKAEEKRDELFNVSCELISKLNLKKEDREILKKYCKKLTYREK